MSVVDLNPFTDVLVQVAASALLFAATAMVSWAGAWIAKHWGWKVNQAQVAAFDDALQKLIGFGAAQANDLIQQRGWAAFEVKNAILAHALGSAAEKFPDALRGVGLDPTAPDFTNKLRAALEARYPTAMVPIAASPVTPPAPNANAALIAEAPAAHV